MTVLSTGSSSTIDAALLGGLLQQADRDPAGLEISVCAAGHNNRIYDVQLPAERLALKQYSRRSPEARDRMGSEWAFLKFAEAAGLDCTPRTVAIDFDSGLALYEFVEGTKLDSSDIDVDDVRRVAEFVSALNAPAARALGRRLPVASETSFSITGHLALMDQRLTRLLRAGEGGGSDFAEQLDRMVALSQRIRGSVSEGCNRLGLDPDVDLPRSEQVISPSDLGFHNILRKKNGEFVFVDFEYAGWDDPAKLVADFFLQPALPVPETYRDMFVEQALPGISETGKQRLSLLTPLFGLRWCFIVFNPYLPNWVERHPAGISGSGLEALRQTRLAYAKRLTKQIEQLIGPTETDGP